MIHNFKLLVILTPFFDFIEARFGLTNLSSNSNSYFNFTSAESAHQLDDPLRRFTNLKAMVSYLQCGDDRACREIVTDMIQDYGCFCYPNDDQQVRGSPRKPVDSIDSACRRLHRAWNCVEMDAVIGLNGISYRMFKNPKLKNYLNL